MNRAAFTTDWLKTRTQVNAETGCWEYMGHIDRGGYGRAWVEKRSTLVHREVFAQVHGYYPETVDHLCRNRKCFNPAHLDGVTEKENVLRGYGPTAINARKTECKYGHSLTDPQNVYVYRGRRDCRICAQRKRDEWKAKYPERELAAKRKYNRKIAQRIKAGKK